MTIYSTASDYYGNQYHIYYKKKRVEKEFITILFLNQLYLLNLVQ